jgi:hypothetical protein
MHCYMQTPSVVSVPHGKLHRRQAFPGRMVTPALRGLGAQSLKQQRSHMRWQQGALGTPHTQSKQASLSPPVGMLMQADTQSPEATCHQGQSLRKPAVVAAKACEKRWTSLHVDSSRHQLCHPWLIKEGVQPATVTWPQHSFH